MYDEQDELFCEVCGKRTTELIEIVIAKLRYHNGEYLTTYEGDDCYVCPACLDSIAWLIRIKLAGGDDATRARDN